MASFRRRVTATPAAVAATTGWVSKRRLAGIGEFARQERAALRGQSSATDSFDDNFGDEEFYDEFADNRRASAAAKAQAKADAKAAAKAARAGKAPAQSGRGLAGWLSRPDSDGGRKNSGRKNGGRTDSDHVNSGRHSADRASVRERSVPQRAAPKLPADDTPLLHLSAQPLRRVVEPERRSGHRHTATNGRPSVTGPAASPYQPASDNTPRHRHSRHSDRSSTRTEGGERRRRRSSPEKGRTRARKPRRRHRVGRIFGWTLLGVALLVIGGSAWVGWRTYEAYIHLQAASNGVSELQDQLTDISAVDPEVTASTVSGLQKEAADASAAVDDPMYRAATSVPFIGPNLAAIGQIAVTVDALAQDVMPSLVDVASTLEPSALAPENGAIDLAPIQKIAPLLQSADVAVNDARAQLATIDRAQLMRPVGDAVETLSTRLQDAGDVTEPAARAARLLPPMLGAGTPRTYLVVFQNPSELRATGGIFGSYAVLKAENGKLSLSDQGASSRNLGQFDPPVAELTASEQALYSDLMARYPQDVNFTPDFPRAAELFTAMYKARSGNTVDGVLAIDPVALSYLLEGAPGIEVGEGFTLRSDNLVDTLLSTAYSRFDDRTQEERDAFLGNATSAVFSRVMAGQAEPTAIIDGLRKAADERRVLVYSADAAEEADIAQTGLAGALDSDPTQPSVGVFMNDGTAAKLGYYLRNAVHVTEGQCRSDGRRELQVRVTMAFDAPPPDAPSYVTGQIMPGQPYVIRTNVLAFAPVGGTVVAVQRDGVAASLATGEDHGRQVGTLTVELAPGATTELVFTVRGPRTIGTPVDVTPTLVLTPGVNPWRSTVDPFKPCSAETS